MLLFENRRAAYFSTWAPEAQNSGVRSPVWAKWRPVLCQRAC